MWLLNFNTLLNWITAFALFEIPLSFFYYYISKKGDVVRDWYSNKTINIWNVLAQDFFYAFCGIIIALKLFNHFDLSKNIFIFLVIVVGVQLIGDSLFALTIYNWPKNYDTKWTKYFKNYIKNSGINALLGDAIYVITWSLTYLFVTKNILTFDNKIFIIFLFLFLTSAYSEK
tara:strand:+ start:4620 stop:5138 length:519 start_codon:yes stop_codon:yes gene_type:complete